MEKLDRRVPLVLLGRKASVGRMGLSGPLVLLVPSDRLVRPDHLVLQGRPLHLF